MIYWIHDFKIYLSHQIFFSRGHSHIMFGVDLCQKQDDSIHYTVGGWGDGTPPFRGNRKFHSFDGWQSNGIFPARLILVKSPLGVIHTGKHSVVYRYGNDSKRFVFFWNAVKMWHINLALKGTCQSWALWNGSIEFSHEQVVVFWIKVQMQHRRWRHVRWESQCCSQ